ncbi:RNA polymerase sigma-70 factor (ECF subfamily) [Rhodopirellula rubra]|uniref:RNA polymerase sigma-70 factor (ECF subfamily) n=1 Tax=Aporhodopirellula rubra TaxID=980271 RepID=A0A7W5H5Q9_9BACT|nr:sigma-70 family RNA polymerase sigma factor [Aporhodopirellula rubra]MBB3206106.1 RNA polymerase sigma-70 factor (ECF subfamily) [Aporhodopirellula rubra]
MNTPEPKDPQSEVVGLIAQHQSRLRGFLRSLLTGHDDVDDLLQEVNMVLWKKAGDFEIGTDFWAWSSQVARFKVMERIRKYSRDRLVFDESFILEIADLASERSAGFDDERSALRGCLERLPPAQRTLLEMRYTQNLAIGRIAQEMSRPSGSIRQTLYRIRGLLMQCIESRLGTQE